MGEVYRALDARIDRDVAIKVLPTDLTNDPDRLDRFGFEARITGSLNHPNILTVHDIGLHNQAPYIVTELLEGEDLRKSLMQGALTLRKAIDYAQQIIAGLAAAHEKGIVHRDLKPENLFITRDGRVKILDFGLAKLKPPNNVPSASNFTTYQQITNPGTVMGTAPYMSPEQVRGEVLDYRSDLFSFGAILYEMLCGKRAFHRETTAETMTAILKEEPLELSEINSKVTPQLEKIVRRCLEKKPERRFQSTSDLGFALEALSSSPSSGVTRVEAVPGNRNRLWMLVAVITVLALVALGVVYMIRSTPVVSAVRLSFTPPGNLSFNDAQGDVAVLSPDGRKILFTARSDDNRTRLWVRTLDSLDARQLPGTEDPIEPFWSPDSRSVAFGSQGKLKRVDLSGGASQVLCDAARLTGGAWCSTGTIVFGSDFGSPLFQIPATGGEPATATIKDASRGDLSHVSPNFLPDGRHFLFRINTNTNPKGVWIGSTDSTDVKQVLRDNTVATYAPPGWLLFLRNDALMAQQFDDSTHELKGDAVPIITRPANESAGRGSFSVSQNGVLLWQDAWEHEYQLVWFNREGKQTGTVGSIVKVTTGQEPRISSDGQHVVLKLNDNIWVVDVKHAIPIRLNSTFSQLPVWSPDGKTIIYNGRKEDGVPGIFEITSSGTGKTEALLKGVNFPKDASPDGRFILFIRRGEKTRGDVFLLPRFGERKERVLLNSIFDEGHPSISPDGHWLAYVSDESGSSEVYVQSFIADGTLGGFKKRISAEGGTQPTWRGDGQELFYVALNGEMMSVDLKSTSSEFEYTAPKPLFKTRMLIRATIIRDYDVTPDGQRFLIGTLMGDSKGALPVVILNWTADLNHQERMP